MLQTRPDTFTVRGPLGGSPSALLCVLMLSACASGQSTPPSASGDQEANPKPQAALIEALPNGAEPSPNVFVAGQPSVEALDLLPAAGVATVVNLRAAPEMTFDEQAAVEARGMRYVSIEVAGAEGLTLDNVRALDNALQGSGAFLVHCGSSNRVGALFALRAGWLQKLPEARALEVGRSHGLAGLEGAVRERLAQGPPAE